MPDESVPTQSVVPSNKNFNFHKVFAAIGVILVVVIVVVGGVWAYVESQGGNKTDIEEDTIKVSTNSAKIATKSSEKDETAEWKTYTNRTLGFSIKYPNDWTFEDQINNQGVSFKRAYKSEGGRVTSGQIIDISKQENPTGKSISIWWQKDTASDYIVSDEQSFKVDGRNALKYTVKSGGTFYGSLIDDTGVVFVVDVGAEGKLQNDTLVKFNLMISTFKFL